MKKVILDTSFVLTCIKQKIDFFDELSLMGILILIPKQVIVELKGVDKSGLSLKLLENNSFEEINIRTKNVDAGIIKYGQENPKVIIATLDKEIKTKSKNSKLVIREKKRLEII